MPLQLPRLRRIGPVDAQRERRQFAGRKACERRFGLRLFRQGQLDALAPRRQDQIATKRAGAQFVAAFFSQRPPAVDLEIAETQTIADGGKADIATADDGALAGQPHQRAGTLRRVFHFALTTAANRQRHDRSGHADNHHDDEDFDQRKTSLAPRAQARMPVSCPSW